MINRTKRKKKSLLEHILDTIMKKEKKGSIYLIDGISLFKLKDRDHWSIDEIDQWKKKDEGFDDVIRIHPFVI